VTIQAFRHLRARERRTTRSGLALCRIAVVTCIVMLPIRAFVDSRYLPSTKPGNHTWSALGTDQGELRANLLRRLEAIPGTHVVFVQYHRLSYRNTEWVYNGADIDGSRIVWARDMGPEKNQEVLGYYPDRKAWLVTPDDAPDALLPYDPAQARTSVIQPIGTEVCPAIDSPADIKVFRPRK
jgi:hypothetical protein